jgi:hypothetical protein
VNFLAFEGKHVYSDAIIMKLLLNVFVMVSSKSIDKPRGKIMSAMRVKLPNSEQQEITPLHSAELAEKISMIIKKRKSLDRSRLERVIGQAT